MSKNINNQSNSALKTQAVRESKKALTINVLLVIGILIVVNLISINFFTRLDFSKGKIYSLTKSSRETVGQLPDRLIVKAYVTRNLPAQFADVNRYTRDILAEYQAYSRGKIRFEFIDPSDDEQLRQEAQRHQVTPVTMRVVEQDKLEIREVFMGLVFMYRGKTETIPFIQNTGGLEYDITSTIKKITDIGRRKVGIYVSEDPLPPPIPGAQQPRGAFDSVKEMLSEHYVLESIDLREPVADDVNTLIAAGINDSLHIEQLYNLDQFMMRDGNLLLFQNRVNADLQTMQANLIRSNVFDLLEHYGIRIKRNLVTDANAGQIQVQRQQGFFSFATPVNYPPFPVINNINRDNIIVKNLENLQMIFVSELEQLPPQAKLSLTPLLMTSDNSGEIREPNFDISFEKYMQQRDLRRVLTSPSKTVAALYQGEIESYYQEMFPDEDDPLAGDFYYRNPHSRIVLVADADFIKDGAGAGSPSNLDFVLNSVDYLMDETVLIDIRARETVFKPLREISPGARKIVRWLNILLPSFFLIIFGFVKYHRQLEKRKVLRSIYEQE
jgi:gliding-associated putative ABC transporter substrate-binding component GldG